MSLLTCGGTPIELNERDVNESKNLYFVRIEQPEVKPVEHCSGG